MIDFLPSSQNTVIIFTVLLYKCYVNVYFLYYDRVSVNKIVTITHTATVSDY